MLKKIEYRVVFKEVNQTIGYSTDKNVEPKFEDKW